MNKYDQKAKEIISYCKKRRMKYRLIGLSLILGSAAVLLTLAFAIPTYSLVFSLALLIAPKIESDIIVGKISDIDAYQNERIDLIESLQTVEELKLQD